MNKPKFKVGDKVNRKLLKKYWKHGDFIGTIEQIDDYSYIFEKNEDGIGYSFSREYEDELELYNPISYLVKKYFYSIVRFEPELKKNKTLRKKIALKILPCLIETGKSLNTEWIRKSVKLSFDIADAFIEELNNEKR